MSNLGNIEVALIELARAEQAALRAQQVLQKLVNNGSATSDDTARFSEIATTLYGLEMGLYTQIQNTLSSLPTAVSSQVPAPTLLQAPTAAPLGAIQIPIGVVWALVALAVLLALITVVAVAYTISVTIDTISQIILTYRAGDAYADALQARVACMSAGRSAADCNAAIVLPAPPTPPSPPVPVNPNTPWYVGGTIIGGLGALAIGLWFLERRAKRGLSGGVIDLRPDGDGALDT